MEKIWEQDEKSLIDILETSEGAAIEAAIKEELETRKIDLKNPEYRRDSAYRDLLTKHIVSKNFYFLTYDYYIEKFILPKMEITKENLGLFDMGAKATEPNKVQQKQLIEEIRNTIVKPLSGNQENTIKTYDDNENDKYNDYEYIRHKLFDKVKRSGLFHQFEEVSNIHFDDFKDKYSQFKFLKLLFKLSKALYSGKAYYGKPVNFYLMFQKPSFENLDKTLISEDESNGKNIALLKNELTKEVPLTFMFKCNNILRCMVYDWDKIVKYAQDLLFNRSYEDLKKLKNFIADSYQKYVPGERYGKDAANNSSLFSTVYFWVLEQECLCVRKEMIHMNSHIASHITANDYIDLANMNERIKDRLRTFDPIISHEKKAEIFTISSPQFEMYYQYESSEFTIQIPCIKSFIKHFEQELSEMLVLKNFSTNEALNLLKKSSENIKQIAAWNEYFNPATLISETHDRIPVSFIMASLFAMRDTFINSETTGYSYYGAKKSGTTKLMSDCQKVIGRNSYCQMLWLKKISNIQMSIKYSADSIMDKLKIEELIYSIMETLFSIYDLDEFEQKNHRLLTSINNFIDTMPL